MARGTTVGSFAGWGRETVLGTTVARTIFTGFLSENVKFDQPFYKPKELRSASIPRATRVGPAFSQGTISCILTYTGLESLIKDLFGAVATSTLGSGAKQHDFTLTNDLPSPGLSLEIERRSAAFLYADTKINKATFRFKPGEEAMVDFEVMGLVETRISATSPTYGTIRPVVPSAISVLTLDGSTVDLDELEITFDNKQVVVGKLASLYGREPIRGAHREITGKMVKDFEDAASGSPYDKYILGTTAALIITAAGAVVAGADTYKFTLNLPKIHPEGPTPSIDGPGVRKQTVNFTAVQTLAAGNDEATAQLVNDTATVT